MKTESLRHTKQYGSWPKMNVRRWLNLKKGTDGFHSVNVASDRSERRKSCSDDGRYAVVPEELSEEWLTNEDSKPEKSDLSMFVGTWNVGGNSPNKDLDVRDWLTTSSPADIYVIGFQEIVPLNAGNVLGTENKSPAAKWLSLIHEALNTNTGLPFNYNPTTTVDQYHQSTLKPRASFSDLLSLEDELGQQEFQQFFNTNLTGSNPSSGLNDSDAKRNPGFCLVASKQMVGIFLCVFIRKDLRHHVSNLKISCVGRGIMGYLGNKGSVSISMTLNRTTFCFVCTHLASGQKEGDELKRNLDVMEILKKTRFSRSFRTLGRPIPPDNILGHEKIIWLGDLNYRLSPTSDDVHELLQRNDWQALLEKDQLRLEQKAGRVFEGWEEGKIYFAPTYKYITNSDQYVAQTPTSKEKRRTPAWCDRILWKGEGLKQKLYVRGESKFSDHRPVYCLFSVKVNLQDKQTKITESKTVKSLILPVCVTKVQAEELLVSRTKSCIESIPRFPNS